MTLSNLPAGTSYPDMVTNSTQSALISSPMSARETRASTGKIDVNLPTKKKRNSVFKFIASKSKLQSKKTKKQLQQASQSPELLTMSIEEEAAASKYHQKRRHSRLDANEPIEDVFAGIKFERIEKNLHGKRSSVPDDIYEEDDDEVERKFDPKDFPDDEESEDENIGKNKNSSEEED